MGRFFRGTTEGKKDGKEIKKGRTAVLGEKRECWKTREKSAGTCAGEGKSGKGLFPSSLTLRFAIGIFVLLLLDVLICSVFVLLLLHLGYWSWDHVKQWWEPLILLAGSSVILGSGLSVLFSRSFLAPVQNAVWMADRLAEGDFQARMEPEGGREMRRLAESFNHMARELGSLELLRSDFVNDFSHEFKTPIASIRGFARMLQREDLSGEERREYLEIIVRESNRLTDLATNVLNLSKLEKQTILSGQTEFNCTEQLRRALALLEPRWSKKEQQFLFEGDEIFLTGNKELLDQVWINLLDNAIKFSPEKSVIKILFRKRPGCVLFTLTDQGPGMGPEEQKHVFEKFYQGDGSRNVSGNGLGLSIAKRIVELHRGNIEIVKSDERGTIFEVSLPL